MKTSTAVALVLAISSSFAGLAPAVLAQGPQEKDEAKFIRLTRQLEQAPLSDTDKSARTWLLQWAQASKDITVRFCKVLDPVPGKDIPNSGILATQQIFGNAAYQIAHADQREDAVATQLAGARSALKAYAALLAKDPKARIPRMDELLRKEQAGTLEAALGPTIRKDCVVPPGKKRMTLKVPVRAR